MSDALWVVPQATGSSKTVRLWITVMSVLVNGESAGMMVLCTMTALHVEPRCRQGVMP
jgi:hypothetical protein